MTTARRATFLLGSLFFASAALAQQPQPEPTEADIRIQIVTNQRNQALDLVVALNARLLMLENELKKATAPATAPKK